MLGKQTRLVLTWGSALIGIVTALNLLGFFPTLPQFNHSAILIILGIALFTETYYEEIEKKGRFQLDTLGEALAIFIAVVSIIAGVGLLKIEIIPETIKGIVAFLYLIQSVMLLYEYYH